MTETPTNPKQITVHIKTLPESAHALLDGILADVWDEGYAEGQRYNEGMAPIADTVNPYRERLEPHSFRWGFGREGTVNWACSCGKASGTAEDEAAARRSHASHVKPEPTRDEIAQHLDLVHRWVPPQSFYTMSIDNLRGIHEHLHSRFDTPLKVPHDRTDWAS